ncbi:hypothetical protein DEO72_LG4g459 [Vigna unguiculata]|uniref:Uncharacterized protein n=1 Tax=Vigna unguiculata TaxID=3917 RepID=A0A4D6LLY1_VIGUN|nr:hypothetical protein DEO72_LG4g459 [Vigna unguiculata]
MSQEDMLKRARQLKKQKTTTVGASPSAPPPRSDIHEEISEPDPEPLTRKFKPRDLKTLHESILANLHKAETSSFMLMDQFTNLSTQKTQDLEQKEQPLVFPRTENSRLTTEVAKLATRVKKKDELLSDLNDQLKKLETKKQAWILKEKDLLKNSELLKDQIGSFLNMGFQLALDQVCILCPDADLSQADISKSIIDGQLVETDD